MFAISYPIRIQITFDEEHVFINQRIISFNVTWELYNLQNKIPPALAKEPLIKDLIL